MDVKQLRTFLAVANARSFLAASDAMYISRQAISKTITQLEDELNIDLFVRTQSGAMMTPAGIYFYPRARTLVADFDKLFQDMQNLDSMYRPKIHICMALGIYGVYARALTEYQNLHRMEVEIQVSGCLDADCETTLTDRRADAVVSFTPISCQTADSSELDSSPIVFLAGTGSQFAQRGVLNDTLLHGTPLLLYTGGHAACPWWREPPKPNDICGSDLDFLFSLLSEGLGILPIPKALIPAHIDFAEELPCSVNTEPCKFYFSMLSPSYHNALTYNLLEDVQKEVYSRDNI